MTSSIVLLRLGISGVVDLIIGGGGGSPYLNIKRSLIFFILENNTNNIKVYIISKNG